MGAVRYRVFRERAFASWRAVAGLPQAA
jgi:hypothetical protein